MVRPSVSPTVNTGRYYISVDGVGNNTNSDYSDYNSMGMYFIDGTVVVPPADTTPPTPGTMTWAVTPNALSSSSITNSAIRLPTIPKPQRPQLPVPPQGRPERNRLRASGQKEICRLFPFRELRLAS